MQPAPLVLMKPAAGYTPDGVDDLCDNEHLTAAACKISTAAEILLFE
jgi:hypothetical protein